MNTPLIVAADTSTKKLAFFALHPTLPITTAKAYDILGRRKAFHPTACGEALDATLAFLDEVSRMATARTPKVVFIETPMVRNNAGTALKQGYVNGVVQGCFVKAGFTVHLLNQSTWKSWLGVAPNASAGKGGVKQGVVTMMKRAWPKDVRVADGDPDLLDAAAMARFGAEAIRRGTFVA